jgi:hypothetical protein
MIELEEKSLALHDPNEGVYLFDSFSNFNKLVRILTHQPVEVTNEWIYYTNNNEVAIYNYKTMSAETLQLPVLEVAQTQFYRNQLILLLQNGTIWIYD